MDAKQYMDEIVDPTIADFVANPTSRRHAFLACVVTFHTVDYLIRPKSPASRRKSFADLSPEYRVVDRVTHAFKHVESRDNGDRKVPVFRSDDVINRPSGILDEMILDLSRLDDPIGGVTITSDDDSDLLQTVQQAAEFLRRQL